MRLARTSTIVAPAMLLAGLLCTDASAQRLPGFVTLPSSDFVWTWGRQSEALNRRGSDFEISGSEAGFRCELAVKLHPAMRVSRDEQRELEAALRTSLAFIQDTAYAMYILDQQRQLDWAVLDCDKWQDRELTEAERQERIDRALEKARAEQARRRAREQRKQD